MLSEFRVANLSVVLDAAGQQAHEALRAAWEPLRPQTRLPISPVESPEAEDAPAEVHYRITEDDTSGSLGWALFRDEDLVQRARDETLLTRALEVDLLQCLTAHYGAATIFHAAGLQYLGGLLLLVGDSDAGKSTMTREALKRGAGYLSDDTLVLDGTTLHGLARTVQFNKIPWGVTPSHVADCDLDSYPGWPEAGEPRRVPLYRAGYGYAGPLEVGGELETTVVRLVHATEDRLEPLSSLARLSVIHGATLTVGRPYRTGLDLGRGFELRWANPSAAFELLLAAIG